jgi:hypothetical protein
MTTHANDIMTETKPAMKTFLLLLVFSLTTHAADLSPVPLPAGWDGVWLGDIEVHAGDKVTHRARMDLRIAPVAGSVAKTWIQTYAGQPPRNYEIRPTESGEGRFVMDEKNGVLLDTQLVGNTLLSTFHTGGVLLTSRFELRGDELAVEIATFAEPASDAATQSKVAAFPFRSIQRGVLHRQQANAEAPAPTP